MIKINQNIIVNADINAVWSFLSDFSKSLIWNRFHVKLELPQNYSISKIKKFHIVHNFGFGNYKMIAEILDCKPPHYLSISEYYQKNVTKGFPHQIQFSINPYNELSQIDYTVMGTFGNKVQDISFKPILKGVVIDELRNIKKAIESSELNEELITHKNIKVI